MYRKFQEVLSCWEKERTKEPLMICGARQVGKTWLIKHFCEETYSDYVYINFEENPDYSTAFDDSLSPETVLRKLGIMLGRSIGSECAIIFDEIQLCEKAITALKYFCEAESNYRILCAGSLLGVKLKRFNSSFPVGKVTLRAMYPMDFEEFLIACGEGELVSMIRECFCNMKPISEGIHRKALDLYHSYLFVGGMPRIVNDFIEKDKNLLQFDPELYRSLEDSYLADMTKHVDNAAESLKIMETFNSLPRQLAKENPKFMYKEIRKNANKRDFQSSIDWLVAAGLAYKVNDVVTIGTPLKGYEDENKFKLYMSDTGLLSHLSRLKFSDILSTSDNIYKGAVVENYVVSQLKASGKYLCYYKPSESMEVDLLLDESEGIIPCEIKSGRRTNSKSLRNYCEKYNPTKAIRLSELNFGKTESFFSVPIYAVFCI